MALNNIIRKQTIHFQYNGNTDGLALQKEVSDWCMHDLMPELEKQLERFSIGDTYIRLDKLKIDATIDRSDWQQKIRDAVIRGLKEKLSVHQPVAIDTKQDQTVSYKLDELVIFFFQKGYLPWWYKAVTDDFDTSLKQWVTEHKSDSRATMIAVQLRQLASKQLVERFLLHVTGANFFPFLANIFFMQAETIRGFSSLLDELIPKKITIDKRTKTIEPVQRLIIESLLKDGREMDIKTVLQLLYIKLKEQRIATTVEISKTLPEHSSSSNPVKKIWLELIGSNGQDTQRKIDPEKKTITKTVRSVIEEQEQTTPVVDPLQPLKNISDADLEEGIFIENAGLIIVAPFLPTLFSRLMLVDAGKMVNEDMAAMITQFAATGKTKINETDLVLPKLLCGIDIEKVIDVQKNISTQQQEAVNEMLEAIIQHWAILSTTSIEGLREAFLLRNGKLKRSGNEWSLQVEQKGYDMLLQKLPWSISMIKLSWMKSILRTEWI